jgi:hypothetical protein
MVAAGGGRWSESGALEVVFIDCQVVCLAGCRIGENRLTDVTFGVGDGRRRNSNRGRYSWLLVKVSLVLE